MTAFVENSLGHIGTFKNGVNFTKEQMGIGATRIINVKNLYQDTLILGPDELEFVDLNGKFKSGKDDVKAGDVFFVRSSVKRDGVGVVVVAKDDMPDATHCGFIIRFRPEQTSANPIFLGYALRSPQQRAAIINLSGGATLVNLSQGALTNLRVQLPPLDIQCRIAAILGAYDDLIEVNRRRVALLEGMARGLFEEWFVRFRFPGHEAVPIIDTPDGPLPEGWAFRRLDETLVLQRGFDLPSRSRLPGSYQVISASGEHGFHSEPKVKGPGVITGRSGTIGRVHFVFADHWPLNTTLYVKAFKRGGPAYAFHLLNHIDLAGSSTGSAVPTLNRNHIHGMPIATAPDELLARFETTAINVLTFTHNLMAQNERLAASRDLLLPRLISGQLSLAKAERELEGAA